MSSNKLELTGNLVKDFEIKKSAKSGVTYSANTIAINEKKMDMTTKAPKTVTTFANFTLWAKSAETAAVSLKKGSWVTIKGALKNKKDSKTNELEIDVHSIKAVKAEKKA